MRNEELQTVILKPDAENLKLAGELIQAGEIVAFPTETVYGIGADALNQTARQKIYTAKGRPPLKPLTLHIADLNQVEQVAKITKTAEKLFKAFCPGPLTLILPKQKNLPEFVTGGLSTVGIRFPQNEVAIKFIKAAGRIIAAPSANLSGKKPPISAQEVFNNLQGKVKIILDGGICNFGVSSTIVDISGEDIKILRQGAIPAKTIIQLVSSK